MIFGSTTAQDQKPKKKSLGNVNEDSFNSIQQGLPVAYMRGRQRITGQFISGIYNLVHKKITQTTGKDTTSTVGYTDYADFAIALCMGGRVTAKKVFKVVVNAEIVWRNDSGLAFGAAEYVDLTIPNYGKIRIYRGSYTQPIDTLVLGTRGTLTTEDPRDQGTWDFNDGPNPNFRGMQAGDSHPLSGHFDKHSAYRPVCYCVAQHFKLGRNPSPVPTIEIELEFDVPWFTGLVVDRDALALNSDDRGVNPIGAMFELITDPIFGMKQPESVLYQPDWIAALSKVATIGRRISPKITDLKSATEVFDELMKYFDGKFRRVNGLLGLVVYDHGPIDLTKIPVLTDDDLDGEPDIKPLDWSHINPRTIVTYADREHNFNDGQQEYRNPNARRIVGNIPPLETDMRHFTDKDITNQWTKENGFMESQPIQSGSLPVKREWLEDNASAPDAQVREIRAADRILYNSASRGVSILLRINEISRARDTRGRAELAIENERGYWPQLFVPPAQDLPGGFRIEPAEITNARIVDLPAELRTDPTQLEVAALAMRPRHETVGFAVYYSEDSLTYDAGPANNKFGMFGQLAADYLATSPDVDDVVGLQVNLFGWDLDRVVSMTDSQRDDNTLLCWIDDELFSVGQVIPLGGGAYKIYVRRKIYGTTQAAHTAGASCWFMFASELTPIAAEQFAIGYTSFFKLQPFTEFEMRDLADCSAIPHSFIFGEPDIFEVTHLELDGQGNDLNLYDRIAKVRWEIDYLFDESGFETNEIQAGTEDPNFEAYHFDVFDSAFANRLTETHVLQDNKIDIDLVPIAGQYRSFGLQVIKRLESNFVTKPNRIVVTKKVPDAVTDIVARQNFNTVDLECTLPLGATRLIIARSTDPAFAPTDGGVEIIDAGLNSKVTVQQTEATSYYYRLAAGDDFGLDVALLNFSAAFIVTTATFTPTLSPPSIDPPSKSFTAGFNISLSAPAGMTVRATTDGTEVNALSPEWPGGLGAYGTIAVAAGANFTLRRRGYLADGTPTLEGIEHYVYVTAGAGGGKCATPQIAIATGSLGNNCTVAITAATSGGDTAISYKKNGGATQTYNPAAKPALVKDDYIEAWVTKTGLNNSDHTTFTNSKPSGGTGGGERGGGGGSGYPP